MYKRTQATPILSKIGWFVCKNFSRTKRTQENYNFINYVCIFSSSTSIFWVFCMKRKIQKTEKIPLKLKNSEIIQQTQPKSKNPENEIFSTQKKNYKNYKITKITEFVLQAKRSWEEIKSGKERNKTGFFGFFGCFRLLNCWTEMLVFWRITIESSSSLDYLVSCNSFWNLVRCIGGFFHVKASKINKYLSEAKHFQDHFRKKDSHSRLKL